MNKTSYPERPRQQNVQESIYDTMSNKKHVINLNVLGRFSKDRALIVLPIFIVVLLIVITYTRNAVWIHDVDLWQDVVHKSPANGRGYNNLLHALQVLGNELKEAGRREEAVPIYEHAVELDPNNPDTLYDLALIYESVGRYKDALLLYQETLVLDPSRLLAKRNLAMIYYQLGLVDRSRLEYESIIQMFPNSGEAKFARKMLQTIAP